MKATTPARSDIMLNRWLLPLLTFLSVIWFDIAWCLSTTFTAFAMAETWVNALLLALLLSLPTLVFRRPRLQAAIITLLCLWFEANLLYSRTYFNPIPLSSYLLVGNLGDFTASVTDSLRFSDLGFVVIIAAAWYAALRREVNPIGLKKWGAATLLTAVVSVVLIMMRGGYDEAWRRLENANYFSCRTPMYTPVGWLIHDATTSLAPLTDADRAEIDRFIAATPPLPCPGDSIRPPRSVVLILCESLESWPIGLTLEGKEITPALNRVVADSTTFYAPRIVTQVAAGRSIDAQLLINAGLLPMISGVYAMSHVAEPYPTLTRLLADRYGARASLLTVDKPVTWNQEGVARAFGIDTIVARDSWVNDEKVGSRRKLGDRSFMRQAAAKMSAGEIWPVGTPAFLQIVTYSGHNPFVLPEELDNLRLSGDYDPTVRNYLTMARYTDEALGIILDYLRSRPDYDDMLIVITGDHEGLAAYRPDAVKRHSWVDAGCHTPLIVINSRAGGHFDAPAGQVDIYPTLLTMLGLCDAPWRGLGVSMLALKHPRAAVGQQGEIEADAAVPGSVAARLVRARVISDRIISQK